MSIRPRKKAYHRAKIGRCKRCGGRIRKHTVRCKKCNEVTS